MFLNVVTKQLFDWSPTRNSRKYSNNRRTKFRPQVILKGQGQKSGDALISLSVCPQSGQGKMAAWLNRDTVTRAVGRPEIGDEHLYAPYRTAPSLLLRTPRVLIKDNSAQWQN